jgi:hypothetical protein
MTFNYKKAVTEFWNSMDNHDWETLRGFFHQNAKIAWPNTDEIFSVDEYIRINRMYPGLWQLRLEDVQMTERNIISIVLITSKDEILPKSFRAVAFFRFENGLIVNLTEYFAQDEKAPDWRENIASE